MADTKKDMVIIVKGKDESAKAFKGVNKNLEKTSKKTDELSKKMGKFGKNMRSFGTKMTIGTTLPMVAFGVASVKAFQEQEIAEKRLEQIATQVTGATKEQIGQFKKLAGELQGVGVVGDEVIISGQSQLASFTKNAGVVSTLSRSLGDLAVAQYGTNVSSEQSIQTANLMGKALQGQLGALTRTGILVSGEFKKAFEGANTEQERATVLASIIQDNYGGVNEAMRETAGGGMQALKNSLGDLGEEFGSLMNEYLTPLVNKLSGLIKKFSGLSDGTKKTILIVAGLLAILGPFLIIIGTLVTAIGKLKIVLAILASPIGLVVIAIGLLIASGYLLIKNWDKVKEAGSFLWDSIKELFNDGAEWLGEIVDKIYNKLEGLISKVKTALSFVSKISGVEGAINMGKNIGGMLSGNRALGGNVAGGSSYLVGERGPELFTPGRSGSITPNNKMGGGKSIVINITGNTLMDRKAGEKIGDQIIRKLKLSNNFA